MKQIGTARTVAIAAMLLFWGGLHGQEASTGLPSNYRIVLDTPDVRVLRAHYDPRERVRMHEHPDLPTIFVYLNDSGVIKISHLDDRVASTISRPPTHVGEFRVAPARVERHSIENDSDAPADSVLVELKTLPPNSITKDLRVPAPKQPLLTGTATVYESPALRVERVICDPGATCTINPEPAPSILVAVTSSLLFGSDRQAQTLDMKQPASVLGAGQQTGVRSAGATPAQLLRVVLLTGK